MTAENEPLARRASLFFSVGAARDLLNVLPTLRVCVYGAWGEVARLIDRMRGL